MEIVFIQLAIILFIAFIVSYIIKLFKQPIIVGYIIAGMIISPFIIGFGASKGIIDIFSQFGIALLLFIVGLHMNPKIIKEIGTFSLLIGTGQIILTFLLGFLISVALLRLDIVTSFYIAIAVSLSSTIIIMKILSDKRQLDSLHGKISIGILIVQDLVAVAVLMFISSISNGNSFSSFATKSLLTGVALIVILLFIGFFILPKIVGNIAKSQEVLFLFSITWCFLIAALFSFFGFSIEIGALTAGIILSISPYSTEISSKIKPLRDFFLIIFFIILGLNLQISSINSIIVNSLILSVVVLTIKPLILMTLMAIFGYTKKNNFLVGVTLAQLSEFSFVILALGVSVGHITADILSTITLTGIITIALSSYAIIYSDEFYSKMSRFVYIFERKEIKRERKINKKYDAILFGYNRIGFNILRALKRTNQNYIVVDFNPDVISNLKRLKIPCVYGDAYDEEFLNELPLNKIQLAISTIPDFETNFLIIEKIKLAYPKTIIIARADQIKDALQLYKKGANYVLTPHLLGGEYVAKMIKELKTNEKEYSKEKEKHLRILEERKKMWKNYQEDERY